MFQACDIRSSHVSYHLVCENVGCMVQGFLNIEPVFRRVLGRMDSQRQKNKISEWEILIVKAELVNFPQYATEIALIEDERDS